MATALVAVTAIPLSWWTLAEQSSAGAIFGIYSTNRFTLLLAFSYGLGWLAYFALSARSAWRKAANCITASSTLVATAGLIELPALAGWVDYRNLLPAASGLHFGTNLNRPWDTPSTRFDPDLLYSRRPGHYVGETPGDLVEWLGIVPAERYAFDIQYDRHGFRNDHDLERADIAVIGDSFVEAGLVPASATLCRVLEREVERSVANLGLGGYGPHQELIVLRRYALPLSPKVVVWVFFEGNDLLDVRRYERLRRELAKPAARQSSFRDRSFTRCALRTVARLSRPRLLHETAEARQRSCQIAAEGGRGARTLYFPDPIGSVLAEDPESLEIAERDLLEARDRTIAAGARFVILFAPTKLRVYRDRCVFPSDSLAEKWPLDDLPSRWRRFCDAHSLDCLDTTPALRRAAAEGELVYFTDDKHWNPRGHALVARDLIEFLRARHWFE